MTTVTNQQSKVYPGLLCEGMEFFVSHGTLKVMSNGSVMDFKDAPYSCHQILEEALEAEPDTEEILKQWWPNSKIKRLIQFGSCRFGGLDYQADVKDFKLQDGEYCDCPARGLCPGEGIVCKPPKYNGVQISFLEVKILKALAGTDTNEVIAEKLKLPFGTYHLFKKELYKKLKIQTKQEAATICHNLNLI